jgi:WD40 repeat protein
MAWDPFSAFHLYGSLDDGQVVCVDLRMPSAPLFTFQAHDKTTSSISFSSGVPGMFATSSIDKTVKIWDLSGVQDYATTALAAASSTQPQTEAQTGKASKKSGGKNRAAAFEPKLAAYKTMNVGKLFALQYYSDDPFLLATAGDKGMVAVWESDESEAIRAHFEGRAVAKKEEGNVYTSLAGTGNQTTAAEAAGAAVVTGATIGSSAGVEVPLKSAVSIGAALSAAAAVATDDSWMDEPATVTATAAKGSKEHGKKDKQKKNKKT